MENVNVSLVGAFASGFLMLMGLLSWVVRRLFSELQEQREESSADRRGYLQSLGTIQAHHKEMCDDLRRCIADNHAAIVQGRIFLEEVATVIRNTKGKTGE